MASGKEQKQAWLATCFKELLAQYPFRKISVKMITDRAGIGRSAFYKYFADKYELLNFIAEYEVMRKVDMLLEARMLDSAIELLFRSIAREAGFFRSAFEVGGQNSFERGFSEILQNSIKRLLSSSNIELPESSVLSLETLSMYYSSSLVQFIKAWLLSGKEGRVEDLMAVYRFLIEHSLSELVQGKKD